jgi:hypothetical protein
MGDSPPSGWAACEDLLLRAGAVGGFRFPVTLVVLGSGHLVLVAEDRMIAAVDRGLPGEFADGSVIELEVGA